jgi:hypothetical protein
VRADTSASVRTGAGSGSGRSGSGNKSGGGVGALTGLGAALLLVVASSLGALMDLFLVGGPDWALTALYVAACGYTARRVRPADCYSALVAPPLAFVASILVLADLMPDTFGHGLLGLGASSLALLAAKAKALYFGTALTAAVLVVRRFKARRAGRTRNVRRTARVSG